MKENKKIQNSLILKALYFIFICFLSFPASGYIYNFQEFQFKVKTELVTRQSSKKAGHCYRLRLTKNDKEEITKESDFQFNLILYVKETLTIVSYNSQKLVRLTIDKVKSFPPNKYHYDTEEVA